MTLAAKMEDTFEILKQFGEKLLHEIQVIIPDVSGKTLKSIRYEIDKDGNVLTIYGAGHIGTLEEGRGATKKSGPGDLIPALQAWIESKGVRGKDGKLLSPYAIAANMHKYGNTLHRMKTGRGPVNHAANPIGLAQVLNQDRIDTFKDVFARQYLNSVKSEILKDLR